MSDDARIERIAQEAQRGSPLATLVRQLQGVLAGTARGTATLTFAANNDADVTVPHGLNGTPSNVQLTPRTAGTDSIAAPACTARDATNITIKARDYLNNLRTGTVDIDWVASL